MAVQVLLLIAAGTVIAQEYRGRIQGSVSDPTKNAFRFNGNSNFEVRTNPKSYPGVQASSAFGRVTAMSAGTQGRELQYNLRVHF